MTPEWWSRVQDLFHRALEKTGGARRNFVREACAGEERLESEVLSLLSAHLDGGLLDADSAPALGTVEPHIGPYHLLRPLGEGGMGSVYLAERREPDYTQTVALKLLRAGFASPALEERLRGERRILAALQHPNIARLIDGGATPAGQPYFAMEYVEGTTLLGYCDREALSVPDRIRLFLEICEPVHYAHQQLVVHRDLKPGNIMVTEDGHPKLLDFGIAKVVDPMQGIEGATATVPCFTPAYASPEQVRASPVGTHSDVYSLGIILYEMLTGRRPYQVDSNSPAEIERIVCEQVPDRPSIVVTRPASVVGAGGDAVSTSPDVVSAARASTPERLRRSLSGDLDTIVLKALAKEPDRRYATVAQLADDLQRQLDGRPVLARPDSLVYRSSKFVRRHRTATAAATVAALSLLTGAVVATRQASIAAGERDRAQEEAGKAARVAGLMVDLFRLSDPTETLGDTITAREILDRGTQRIEREFGDQPDVQADLFHEVAQVYANLGLLGRAESLVRRAVTVREQQVGPDGLEVSNSLSHLGRLLRQQGQRDDAIQTFRRSIAIREGMLSEPDSLLVQTQADLAWLLRDRGDSDEAAALFRTALESQGGTGPRAMATNAYTMLGLAATYHDRGQFDEAEALFQRALADHDTTNARPDPMAATALLNVGMIRRIREQYAAAEPLLNMARSMRTALYGPDHPAAIEAAGQVISVWHDLSRYREAEALARDALRRADGTLDTFHPTAVSVRQTLASVLTNLGRYAEATALYDTVVTAKRRRYAGDHPDLVFTLIQSGRPHLFLGEFDAATQRFEEAHAMGRRVSGERSVYHISALQGLAAIAHRANRVDDADSLYQLALELADDLLRPNHRYTLFVERTYAHLLLDQGNASDAADMLQGVLTAERAVLPEPHRNVGMTLMLLGRSHLEMGQAERAEQLLEAAIDNFAVLPETHFYRGEATNLLGAALVARGRSDLGTPLLEQGIITIRRHLGDDAPETARARARR